MASSKSQSATSDTSIQRTPTQARAIARVDAILGAAKNLIREQGSANLKIQEIAKRAGVTAGSMYQYFPNKAAILEALAQQNIQQVRMTLLADLPEIESIQDCVNAFSVILDRYFELYRSEPALRDIWVSTAADKQLQDMDIEDSRQNAELVYTAIKYAFPKKHHKKLKRFLFLLMHWTGATVRLALTLDKKEGDKMMALMKEVVSEELIGSLFEM